MGSSIKLDSVITDIAAGPFGSNLKVDCFVPSGFPIIDGANLKGFKVTDNLTKFVTEEKARSLARSIARRGEVVVTISGTLGQISYIPNDSQYLEYLCSQRQFRVAFDTEQVYVPYLVFYFHTREGQNKILAFANQTGVPALAQPTKNFRNIEIDLPVLEEQKRIAAVAEYIENKIELNNQLNDYLAELMRALFQEKVVNVDAFDKTSLSSIATYKNGLAMQKFRPEGADAGLPVVKIKELGLGYCPDDCERCSSSIEDGVKLHDGDLVFSWSGTLMAEFWVGGDAGLNQHLFKVTSDKYPKWFYYLWTKYHLQDFIRMAKNHGTTMGHIKRGALDDAMVNVPDQDTLVELDGIFSPMVDLYLSNAIESRKLSQLRDTLLPKLMSGEIDVSKVDITQLNNHLVDY